MTVTHCPSTVSTSANFIKSEVVRKLRYRKKEGRELGRDV